MKKILILTFCLVLAATLTACGCEKTVEKAIEQSTGGEADVDLDDGSVKVNTNEGSLEIGEEVDLPSGFPSDIYVIDGTITAAMSTGEDTYTVSIETTKSVSEAKAKYESELENDGWDITMTLDIGEGSTIGAEKDNRSVSISIAESDGATTVVIGTSTMEE